MAACGTVDFLRLAVSGLDPAQSPELERKEPEASHHGTRHAQKVE